MTTALILNLVLATLVLAAVLGLAAWSIATQSRDQRLASVRRARPRRAVTVVFDHPPASTRAGSTA